MSVIKSTDKFVHRHNGINKTEDLQQMLDTIGVNSLDQLIDETVPANIRLEGSLNLPEGQSEFEYLQKLKQLASKNKVYDSYIGMGYYGTITPAPILRNLFENPGWYTQYTPYQAEIAQGRLESLLNFQTMVSDLTGLPIANASLLDEGTAAAEAMSMFYGQKNKRSKTNEFNEIFVDSNVFDQTLDIIMTRAIPLGINVVVGDMNTYQATEHTFAVVVQYPGKDGKAEVPMDFVSAMREKDIFVVACADLLSLTLLKEPGAWGANAVVGNTQRFGVPMGFGGPHAAYFATEEKYKRVIPGRIIGVSKDKDGNKALRMALQTREQHIRREKATSNICTAQALLANMAAMYGVYHGPEGLKAIANRIHATTVLLGNKLTSLGFELNNKTFFDTLSLNIDTSTLEKVRHLAEERGINFFYGANEIRISVDETCFEDRMSKVLDVFEQVANKSVDRIWDLESVDAIPADIKRASDYMLHPVFNSYHTESGIMRYLKTLENRDLSLTHSMISLGSCTMKLNAASEMIPVSWPEFSTIHPFAPNDQVTGYHLIIDELSKALCEITGFTDCSLQPNSGAQGEYTGLMAIRQYHISRGEAHRNVAIIPSSAHGTNPASAVMAGMKVVVVACDERGNIDVVDLKAKADEHKENLSALMVTYPSTHGVFETSIREICDYIHASGGMVYMDGANMNAQVGLTNPALIGADVCHLNLHKTFAIPHGGGGPGMGPICVNDHLAPFLPKHVFIETGGEQGTSAVSAAPFGSASILLISYGYIKMLGAQGLVDATKIAILNANYIKARLEGEYSVLYTGDNGRAAHEMIIDLRPFKAFVSAEDVAKRLMDYGFHAPTLSFPVAGTIMIEPTESEDLAELDRFCDAFLQIKAEIDEIARGDVDGQDNVLANAPHCLSLVTADEWNQPYSRSKAAYPLDYIRAQKFWPTIRRVDNAQGDRNLICTCPPLESYMEE
ncbi:MAG: aminomethyl-transferring glycine dehydrogenase [Saprospiraceae bacterium]|nr:aminomethyl-transferring glycine dehydrogenase [Saprospiraceae bacterium]